MRRDRSRVPSATLRSPAACVVRGFTEIPGEGGVGDDAGVPGVRLLGGERVGEVRGPARVLVVEVGQLLGGERAAEPAAQLVLDLTRHPLEDGALLRRGGLEAAQARRPLV